MNARIRGLPFAQIVALTGLLALGACRDQKPAPGPQGDVVDPPKKGEQGSEPEAEQNQVKVANPYDIGVWHQDFPFPAELPSHRRTGRRYQKSMEGALQKVIQNLQGNCTDAAWKMAKEFFSRQEGVDPELLIEALDDALTARRKTDFAHNLVEVMGRVGNPAFAKVLVRAAQHSRPGIRRNAVRALVRSGDSETILKVQGIYLSATKLERHDWVKAAYRHLSDADLKKLTQALLTQKEFLNMQNTAMEMCLEMPPKRANAWLEDVRHNLPRDLQLYAASIAHAAGDGWGTGMLRQALSKGNHAEKMLVCMEVHRGAIKPLLDELLALTSTNDERMAIAVILAIQKVADERVEDALLMYTAAVSHRIRQSAYRALLERGKTDALKELLNTLRKSTGSKFQVALADLVGANYGPVVGVLMEKYGDASPREQLSILRSISSTRSDEAFEALRKIFLAPEKTLPTKQQHTTVSFLGVLFSNLTNQVPQLIKLFEELPKSDYRRRAAVLYALAGLANVYHDRAWRQTVFKKLRGVLFDRDEIPQMRMLALDQLRQDIRLEDAMRLKRMMAKEEPGLRNYISDYLFQFF